MLRSPQSRRRGNARASEESSGQSARRARSRLFCGFGCPCCGPPASHSPLGLDGAAHTAPAKSSTVEGHARQSLAVQAAAVDGSRDPPYVDTHVHLEMVLQKIRWYEAAPSLLESSWERLSDSEQRCWRALGFVPSMWDQYGRKGSNPTWFTPWNAISAAQRSAAQALGWDAAKWDGFEWLLPKDAMWRDLEETTREHLSILGESCDSWDEMFGLSQPAGYCVGGDMRRWQELSLAEQEAASRLGFTPPTWDMVELADIHAYVRDFCGTGFEACITQGCDGDSIDDCVKLALEHPQVFAALGCHPKNAWLYEEERLEERLLAAFRACGKKAIAWGEFGLDFSNALWGYDEEYRQNQISVFERQLQFALERQLPLVLHVREAAEDALRLLQKWVPRSWKAHIHAFHGPSDFVTAILELFPSFYFGVTGTVSMGLDGDGARMARIVPVDRMLLETDGPYMLPRGTVLNHPGQIPLVARLVADVRGCDAADVLVKARANTRYVYGI
mmetsp:Transcript_48468/g.135412  ORF Transcript_48468/g.135412 Transcript_48468/m.135412 type:complete len:503 (+) Transcript_48468:77-1585(+)